MVDYLLNIYNQIVQDLIRDRKGRQYYENVDSVRCEFQQNYNCFIDFITSLVKDYIVDVHTLNHDLLFESFSNILNTEVNDGFKEYGSKYYGVFCCNGFEYTCRLQAYTTDNYNQASINLYKLHGSVNYVPFYKKGVDGISRKIAYLKSNKGINITQLYMEDENKGEFIYSESERHYDFLTGTTKAIRYNDFFFQELFCNFKCNLKNAEKLIIIGYGGKDKEINKYIVDNFDYEHKPVFIVDPKPSETLMNFANRINAQIIEKTVSEIDGSDFESSK
ncbi:SIR2 family protein [Pseudoprevotella muciniphila]|uniref:SIR2 family protein n=1 Tax=Pseudoprevotella muciniphila TaxID=2133944 RepID=UPI0018678870|nr:SIR2 family protein [Pseudoprevotella muciniphila]